MQSIDGVDFSFFLTVKYVPTVLYMYKLWSFLMYKLWLYGVCQFTMILTEGIILATGGAAETHYIFFCNC